MRMAGDVRDRVNGLAVAVDAVAEIDPAELSADVQLDLLRALHPLLNRLDAQLTRTVGVVNTQGSAAQEGALSTIGWLRSRLHAGSAAQRVQVAKGLAELPDLAGAYQRGEISFSHAQIAIKAAKDISAEVLAAGVDKLLAEQATEHTPGVFARAALRIHDHYVPDAADKRARRESQSEWLDVDKTFGGAVSISGMLAPEGGELLLQTLGAFLPPVNPDELVPATARRAEALLDICRSVSERAPISGGEKPHVTVTIDWDTLRGHVTRLFDQHGAWTGASLGSGSPLTPETARRLACDAVLIPMVLSAASQPLDVGRAQRLVTAPIRRALTQRDGGCRFPGCDRPAYWSDAHHLVHWIHNGPTSVDNMILVCRRHHTMVHEGDWSIHLDHHTGIVTARDPHGRPLDIASHPRAHSP